MTRTTYELELICNCQQAAIDKMQRDIDELIHQTKILKKIIGSVVSEINNHSGSLDILRASIIATAELSEDAFYKK